MNVVSPATGEFVEVQGTAEGAPFDRASSTRCSTSARPGCAELAELQQRGAGS